MSQKYKEISIHGARVHNLKNINLKLPRNKFIVITGMSGSGKSSLAFDTLYAEGQRRYIESLSAYMRQFVGKLEKPDVDNITGISPAVAIEQKVTSRNPRSTVGTSTEIYDYLKLLYARIGKTYSPVSGEMVKRESVNDVIEHFRILPEGTNVILTCPLPEVSGQLDLQLNTLKQQGFSRISTPKGIIRIEDYEASDILNGFELVIDRFTILLDDEDNWSRIYDSVETAYWEGMQECTAKIEKTNESEIIVKFSNRFELDGIRFEEPTEHFFSFNSPAGACKSCEGFGAVMGIDPDLVIPDRNKSVFEEAIVCWKGEKMQKWKSRLITNAHYFDFPVHTPICDLNKEQYDLLWKGNSYFKGIHAFFKYVEEKSYKIQYRVMLSRYRGKTHCPDCAGSRIRKEARWVKINDRSLPELVGLPINELLNFISSLSLSEHDEKVSGRLISELKNRCSYLVKVGLSYLNLNRLSSTLSGGESQRVNLSTSLGSSLVGSMYILDEPSIGLHSRDTEKLIEVLRELNELGNTVIVVEHDEEIMRAADHLVDLGPEAGSQGGEIVFEGDHDLLLKESKGLTSDYLNGRRTIPIPVKRRLGNGEIQIVGANENNLNNIDVAFPLNCFVAVTGVSGSGKSSLIKNILFPGVSKLMGNTAGKTGVHKSISFSKNCISAIEFVDQNPIGRSSRSNPVTYVKAWDDIRSLFSSLPMSKMRGYKPAFFSFNIDGGRCENCQGEGAIHVEMQFMADVVLTCPECKGKRFQDEILEVKFQGKNVFDLLEMTIDDALSFFLNETSAPSKKISEKLLPLQQVGMGYVKLGQPSSTLSGGEAQRIKLASFLSRGLNPGSGDHVLFVFDEPTTGLHFHDILKLLKAFNLLIEKGHSIIVIEHNTDVIKCADWVIDLGPDGGNKGGLVVFEGTPEDLIMQKTSHTGKFLKEKLKSVHLKNT